MRRSKRRKKDFIWLPPFPVEGTNENNLLSSSLLRFFSYFFVLHLWGFMFMACEGLLWVSVVSVIEGFPSG